MASTRTPAFPYAGVRPLSPEPTALAVEGAPMHALKEWLSATAFFAAVLAAMFLPSAL
ncbi:hypothetical protein [Curtobacterium sp. VKM Ac-1376]|uniref:hypothetical protein n=1 Tax=Curtobacterium sp. VKM Ac-1376 TaxID=123312 RepID=UPI00188A5AAF|nr:hypothetical protein [Curtobacterium sp. VKM Ac-1376]MBF4613776.1 hypothetical protein [Curtobacterium sp. VKM Ac-1376]